MDSPQDQPLKHLLPDLVPGMFAGRRSPAVLLAGGLTAMDSPGGGEVQMRALAAALPRVGVAARMWRPWDDDLGRADGLHLFGSLPEHLPLVEMARRRGIPVVLSTIAWFDVRHVLSEPGPAWRSMLGAARFALRSAMPWLPSWRRRLYHAVDLLMPNSLAEARQLTRYFGVSAQRMSVVPNGADARFAEADPRLFVNRFGIRNFVLYAGRIEPRKNQLGFLKAMEGFDAPVVILGDPVPKYADYYDACRLAAGPNVYFMQRLEHDDPMLASAYAACGCLALTSWYETPGLVAIEAGMSGTPLVVTARGCAQEYFGDLAAYVEPNDRQGIRRAVVAALERGRDPRLADHLRDNFSWLAAARITSAAYDKVLRITQ